MKATNETRKPTATTNGKAYGACAPEGTDAHAAHERAAALDWMDWRDWCDAGKGGAL